VFQIRVPDVGHQTPFEAGDQPILEPRDLLRRPIRGEHDLLVPLEQRVERVEELFLRHFLAFEEMHVVHQEEVHVVAVPAPELRHRARVNRFDDFVDELLGAEVVHPRARVFGEHGTGDRLHQVRLAESRGAVDEERIVGLAGCLSDRVRGRRGELVRLSDHERLEGVSLVEWRGRDAGPVHGRRLSWRHEEIHLGPLLAILLHPEHDRRRPSEHALGGARQDGGVLRLVPFDGELIGSSDDQAPIVQRDRHRGLQPRPHRSVGKFAPRFVEESLPSFFS